MSQSQVEVHQIQPHYTIPRKTPALSPAMSRDGLENHSCWASARTDLSFKDDAPCGEGKGDPSLPDNAGYLTGANGYIPKKLFVKYLEDKNTVMRARNQNLITENKSLNNQLAENTAKNEELSKTIATLREEFHRERRDFEMERIRLRAENSRPPVKESETLTSEELVTCRSCQRQLEELDTDELTVVITKSELDKLENDMKTLRDNVVIREEMWDRATEREQNYQEQMARLSVELITVRQLSDSRLNELQTIAQELRDKDYELRTIQKELTATKKNVTKLQKQQRIPEKNLEKDSEKAEKIESRLSSARSKSKSPRHNTNISNDLKEESNSTPS